MLFVSSILKAISSEGVCILCFKNQELIHHSSKAFFSISPSLQTAAYCISYIFEADENHDDGLRDDFLSLRRVFAPVDGASLSLVSRKDSIIDDVCLTYAETDVLSFVNLLREVASDAQVFYDLGCGVGTISLII